VLSLQEISDRLEIQDLLASYSHAIDFGNWDELDEVFTPDAFIDYSAMGGSSGTPEETKQFLSTVMPTFAGYQHMVATTKLKIEGDTAVGRTICHNPMVLDTGDGETRVFFCGLWYRDRFVRTAAGWRIAERVEEKCFFHNAPAGMAT
jgi:hypothetical protein